MLDLIDQTFPLIWGNIIIVINHLEQNEYCIKRREVIKKRSDAQFKKMISDNLRERYNISQELALPVFFLDCQYDESSNEEKAAFDASFMNILLSAKRKEPYNPQVSIAAWPLIVKLEHEKKELEEAKVSLEQMAKENEEKAMKEA